MGTSHFVIFSFGKPFLITLIIWICLFSLGRSRIYSICHPLPTKIGSLIYGCPNVVAGIGNFIKFNCLVRICIFTNENFTNWELAILCPLLRLQTTKQHFVFA